MTGDAPKDMWDFAGPIRVEDLKDGHYRSDQFLVRFNKITTPKFTKLYGPWYKRLIYKLIRRSKWRWLRKLRGWAGGWRCYDVDLRKIIIENSLKDMATPEDDRFFKVVDSPVKSG